MPLASWDCGTSQFRSFKWDPTLTSRRTSWMWSYICQSKNGYLEYSGKLRQRLAVCRTFPLVGKLQWLRWQVYEGFCTNNHFGRLIEWTHFIKLRWILLLNRNEHLIDTNLMFKNVVLHFIRSYGQPWDAIRDNPNRNFLCFFFF